MQQDPSLLQVLSGLPHTRPETRPGGAPVSESVAAAAELVVDSSAPFLAPPSTSWSSEAAVPADVGAVAAAPRRPSFAGLRNFLTRGRQSTDSHRRDSSSRAGSNAGGSDAVLPSPRDSGLPPEMDGASVASLGSYLTGEATPRQGSPVPTWKTSGRFSGAFSPDVPTPSPDPLALGSDFADNFTFSQPARAESPSKYGLFRGTSPRSGASHQLGMSRSPFSAGSSGTPSTPRGFAATPSPQLAGPMLTSTGRPAQAHARYHPVSHRQQPPWTETAMRNLSLVALLASFLLAVSLLGTGTSAAPPPRRWPHMLTELLPVPGLDAGREAISEGWEYTTSHMHRLRVLVEHRVGLHGPLAAAVPAAVPSESRPSKQAESKASRMSTSQVPSYIQRTQTAVVPTSKAHKTKLKVVASRQGTVFLGQLLRGMQPLDPNRPRTLLALPATGTIRNAAAALPAAASDAAARAATLSTRAFNAATDAAERSVEATQLAMKAATTHTQAKVSELRMAASALEAWVWSAAAAVLALLAIAAVALRRLWGVPTVLDSATRSQQVRFTAHASAYPFWRGLVQCSAFSHNSLDDRQVLYVAHGGEECRGGTNTATPASPLPPLAPTKGALPTFGCWRPCMTTLTVWACCEPGQDVAAMLEVDSRALSTCRTSALNEVVSKARAASRAVARKPRARATAASAATVSDVSEASVRRRGRKRRA